MPSQSGFAHLNGTQVYYEIAGSGPPLVLVHAGIADSRMWDEQFAVLARDFTVVRYDLRGFGQTPMTAGTFAHHHDLAALLQHLNIARTALLGCSMGGQMIIDFALEYPEIATALIPVASGVSGYVYEGDRPPQWDALVAAYEQGDLEQASEYEVQIWVDGPHRRPDQVPASIRDRVRTMNLIALATPEDLGTEQPLDPPAVSRLHEIGVPTLVIIGELDQPRILEQCAYIAQAIPRAETVRLPTAHLPNMERPDEFNRIVQAFLQRAFAERAVEFPRDEPQ
jgi:pimeloyl-ACP methyl ester carboxylesterase